MQPGEPGSDEISRAVEMMENRIAVAELTSALSSGMARGSVGPDMDTSLVVLSALDEAIDLVTEMGCQSPQVQQLVTAAGLVRELRAALLGGYWESVQSVLEETGERHTPRVCAQVGDPFWVTIGPLDHRAACSCACVHCTCLSHQHDRA